MDKVNKIIEHPFVAHLLRMNARFTNRLGMQFAGAVTYFSVLAMVPILMFAFAIAGMILTEFRPDLLEALQDSVVGMLEGAPQDVTATIAGVIEDAARNWAGIGLFGLISLAYAGSGWIKNLKSAVRAQFRPAFDEAENKANIVIETLKNLGILILLLLAVAVTFGIASLATSMTGTIIGWVGLEGTPGIGVLTRGLSLFISLAAGWLLFLFLYRVLPEHRPRTRALLIGALIGSAALVMLQYFAGALVGSFLGNPAAALFGPVIVLLLFFNLFARIILMVAAWIATDNQPAVALKWTQGDAPLLERADVVVADELHWPEAEADRLAQEVAKTDAALNRTQMINRVKDALPGLKADPATEKEAFAKAVEVRLEETTTTHKAPQATTTAPQRYAGVDGRKYFTDEAEPVPGEVADRKARASKASGYAAGLATGSGLGALLTLVLDRIIRRR